MKKLYLKRLIPAFLIFFSVLLVSCDSKNVIKVELDSGWKYSLKNPDIEEVELKTLSDAELENLQNLIPSKTGIIYLTKSFIMPPSLQKQDVACYLGRISYSDRTYFNHYLIGSTGYDENLKYSSGYEPRFYDIPEELIFPGMNTITIEIYAENKGYLRSNAFISYHDTAKTAWLSDRFWNSQIYLVFACILLFLCAYSVKTFFKVNKNKDVLFYALMCFITVLHLSLFYINEIPFFNFYRLNYNMFQKINSYVLPAVIFFVFTLFFDSFFERSVKRSVILIRSAVLIIPQLIYLFVPLKYSNGIWSFIPFAGFIPGILQLIFVFFCQLNAEKRNSFKLTMCIIILPLFMLFDVFIHNGMNMNNIPYLANAGWPFSLFAMMFLLSTKKITELKESSSTSMIPVQKIYAQPEPNVVIMPSQPALPEKQSFTLRQAPVLDNYEIAYCFNPSRNRSTDVYDFFTDNNQLTGVAFFETSGADSTASQMTMFSKEVVVNKFTDGKLLPLTKVMENINSKLVNEKGEVDNFLTGILIRVFESRIEYVNVGHAPAFYRNNKGSKCMAIQIKSDNYAVQSKGSLGIEEISSDYKGIGFNIGSGDAVIIYSSSFSDALNVQGEQFGQERICQAFLQSPEESAEAKLKYILNMFQNYTHDVAVEKDLTVIVIQKK